MAAPLDAYRKKRDPERTPEPFGARRESGGSARDGDGRLFVIQKHAARRLHYDLRFEMDGVLKLAVNGKFVNGISKSTQKKGYLCLESEGAEIQFRNLRIMELPPGVTSPEQTAPEFK